MERKHIELILDLVLVLAGLITLVEAMFDAETIMTGNLLYFGWQDVVLGFMVFIVILSTIAAGLWHAFSEEES